MQTSTETARDAAPPVKASRPALSIEEFGLGDPRIKEFVAFPWQLYRNDPCWTPPLNADLLGNRLLDARGLLTAKHPYHESAEVTHFLARRGGRVVGRVSAAINRYFNNYHGTRLGFFGFFEVEEDYEAAAALLDAAREWISARGMTAVRGPGEYSNATHERQGVLIDGFQYPPTVELTHNPPYYAEILERYGFSKVKDYHAYLIDVADIPIRRFERLAEAARRRGKVVTRPIDLNNFTDEVRLVIRIYNEAWSTNWGFLPVTDDEAVALAKSLRPIADPGFVRFAYVDDQPAAVIGALPDPYWGLRPNWGSCLGNSDPVRLGRMFLQRHKIPIVRFIFFGVLPPYRRMGINALLFYETFVHGVPKGFRQVEASMLLEDNELMIRDAESLGGRRYKTWRIYEMEIA
jgi:GNAT superfamily N-acetyltransferase